MASYLVTGTNRGIGLEFVRQLLERGETVLATCRDIDKAEELLVLNAKFEKLELFELDVAKDDSLANFPKRLEGRAVDVFINNAGVYGPRGASFGQVNGDEWLEVLHINAVAPILLTQLLMENLRKGRGKKLVYITSKMGSIDDNKGGGQYIYRSSKTALNSAVKSLSVDLADAGFSVAVVHPGWVLTDMGGPNALIDTKTSVNGMLSVIDNLDQNSSGSFFNYDGKTIAW
jgi:NAD(P)-dependent dehydrogenase (short-subunit alcohol dehydrogenase family)